MTTESEPIRLSSAHIDDATEVLARAFFNDPIVCHMYPNAATRPPLFAKTAKSALRYGIAYGEVHAPSSRMEGVAVWFPPAYVSPSVWHMLRFGFLSLPFSIGLASFRRLLAYVDHTTKMRERHVRGPHWYLQFLAVDPARQGAGHGSRLLRCMLARLDREGLPCCLDTENEKNVAIYEHFGFTVREAGEIPGSGCLCWLMVRDVNAVS